MGHAPDWMRQSAKKSAGDTPATHSDTFCAFDRPAAYFDGGAVTSYRDGGKVQGYARGGFVSGLAAGALAGFMMMRNREKRDAAATTKKADTGFTPVTTDSVDYEDSNSGMKEAADANGVTAAPTYKAEGSGPKAKPKPAKVERTSTPSIIRTDAEREGGAISYPAKSSPDDKKLSAGSSVHYKNNDLKVDLNASNVSGGEREIDPRFRRSANMAAEAENRKKKKAERNSSSEDLGQTFDMSGMNIAP